MHSQFIKIKIVSLFRTFAAACLLSVSVPAMAQNIPDATVQEKIVKSWLLTFNDANLSGNYAVLNALSSKPLRDQLPPEKLKEAFKAFYDNQIDISEVVVSKMVATTPTTVDADGVMVAQGYFDTKNDRVLYTVKTLLSDGKWKLLGINVKTEDLPK